jgi:hypothetical protein
VTEVREVEGEGVTGGDRSNTLRYDLGNGVKSVIAEWELDNDRIIWLNSRVRLSLYCWFRESGRFVNHLRLSANIGNNS